MDEKSKSSAIGIDFGTSYSHVSLWQYGKIEIIPNEEGDKKIANYVAFNGNQRIIGNLAKTQVEVNPFNTVFNFKRLMGRKYDDPDIQKEFKSLPYKVVDHKGKPNIQVKFNGELKTFAVEEIAAMVLAKMKEIAESYTGTRVKNAVISVPDSFTDSQRQAIKDAGAIAGLNVMRLINDSTAAALAYGFDKNLLGHQNILIFGLGGSCCDVSIVRITNSSSFEVKASVGNVQLGGEDFDKKLLDFLATEFKRKYNRNLYSNMKAISRLKAEIERAKRVLSNTTEVDIEIEALHDGIDFRKKIFRTQFEELCSEMFLSAIDLVKTALEEAKLSKWAIDGVVLVGGSTRIPKIQTLLSDFFGGRDLKFSINPDEAVVYGAALQAAILNGDRVSKIDDIKVVDVTPLWLGIETRGKVMRVLIEGNTKIPCRKTQKFTTHKDNQPAITFRVFQGQNSSSKNVLLGVFYLTDIIFAPRGVPQIEVTFKLDPDGIFHVSALDTTTEKSEAIKIKSYRGVLSENDLGRMILSARQLKKDEKIMRQQIAARNKLEKYIHNLKRLVSESGDRLSDKEKANANSKCLSVLEWMNQNQHAEKEKYEEKLAKISLISEAVVDKLDSGGDTSGFEDTDCSPSKKEGALVDSGQKLKMFLEKAFAF